MRTKYNEIYLKLVILKKKLATKCQPEASYLTDSCWERAFIKSIIIPPMFSVFKITLLNQSVFSFS